MKLFHHVDENGAVTTQTVKHAGFTDDEDHTITMHEENPLVRPELCPPSLQEMVERYGGIQPQRQPIYGNMRMDMQLQDAFATLDLADDILRDLPDAIKTKYPTRNTILDGIANGELANDIQKDLASREGKPNKENAKWLQELLTEHGFSPSTETAPTPKNSATSAPAEPSDETSQSTTKRPKRATNT